MASRREYATDEVRAARSVLIEVTHLLGEYRDQIVLVGGWVPEVLLSTSESPHVGSIDVDLALNHRELQDQAYARIQELLLAGGYEQGEQPYIFKRRVPIGTREITVEVDLVAGEYGGTGKGRRHQKIHGEGLARKARGCDLAFDIKPVDVPVEGELPGGGVDSVTVRVASIVPFLVMKGMALSERLKEKDAWDVYYVLQNCEAGWRPLRRNSCHTGNSGSFVKASRRSRPRSPQ